MNMFTKAFNNWRNKRTNAKLLEAAEKGAKALDIMLDGSKWYGGIRVVEAATPVIEVLIVDTWPDRLSTFIPPRIGGVPVMCRFGSLPKAL